MKRTTCLLALLLVLTAAWPQRTAHGDDGSAWIPTADEVQRAAARQACYSRQPCTPRRSRKAWQFEIAVPVWIPGVSGTFGEGSIDVDSDGGIGDVVDALTDVETSLNFAFVGLFSASRGPWTFTVEGFGVRLGNSITFKLTDGTLVDSELNAIIASARAGYRVWTKPFRLFSRRACFQADVYAGLRYYYADFDVQLPRSPKLSASSDWVDPIVGLDMELAFSRRLALQLRGDVGGFGVGADLAFWMTTGLEYRFSRLFSLTAGWAYMTADYTRGSGARQFRWDLSLSGPQLIASFKF